MENSNDVPNLDEETLKLLGYDVVVPKKPNAGEIHQNIVEIWNHILSSGLSQEQRTELINKYPPFSNCLGMQVPKLNVEVKKSISEANLARDTRISHVQSRICAGLSALGGILELLLSGDISTDVSHQIMERTGDAARILADVHFDQSQARRGVLKGILNKKLAETLSEKSEDGWLFGDNLAERIRAVKALNKTAEELKIPAVPKTSTQNKNNKNYLNYKGPTRQYVKPARQVGPKQRTSYQDKKKSSSYRTHSNSQNKFPKYPTRR